MKAREFWICDFKLGPRQSNSQIVVVDTDPNCGFSDTKKIHVIEYSAYTALKAEADKLETALNSYKREIELLKEMYEPKAYFNPKAKPLPLPSYLETDKWYKHAIDHFDRVTRAALQDWSKFKQTLGKE